MQQFLLFCTMLIVASEAFSKKSHSSQSSTRVTRKFSRFAPTHEYPNPDFPMAENLDSPMFLHDENVAGFVAPIGRRGFRRFGEKSFSPKKNNFISSKRFRKKFSSRRNRLSSQFFDNSRLPPLNSVFGDVSSVRYPNQYILPLYPVNNDKQFRSNKRTFRSLKKRRFPVLSRQYLTKLKRTIKRSTNTTCETVTEQTSEEKNQTTAAPIIEDFYNGLDSDYTEASQSTPVTTVSHDLMPDVPLSSVHSQYFDTFRSPTAFPKIDFKYPYDPEVYDASLRRDSNYYRTFGKKEKSELNENLETPAPDINKLKAMLEEVETILKDEKSDLCKKTSKEKKTQEKCKNKEEKETQEKCKNKEEKETQEKCKNKEGKESQEKCKNKEGKESQDKSKGKEEKEIQEKSKDKEEMETQDQCKDKEGKNPKENFKCREERRKCFGKKKKKRKRKKKTHRTKSNSRKNGCELDRKSLKDKIDTVVIPLLKQISEELGKLSRRNNAGPNSTSLSSKCARSKVKPYKNCSVSSNEHCAPDGTWTSSSLGIEMTFATLPNMMIRVNVSNKKLTVNSKMNNRWSIHGLTLSKQGGPLMLAALCPQKRQIASFVGACRTFSNEDMIFGSWTIFTWMKKFTDLWRAVETRLDVLKKKKVKSV